MNRQYYIYLMSSTNRRSLYVGITNDLVRRVFKHKAEVTPGFTQRYKVKNLVYYEVFGDPENAIIREKQIKKWSRTRKNQLVESKNPYWEDLLATIVG